MHKLIAATVLFAFVGPPAIAQSPADHIDARRHLRLGQERVRAAQWDQAEREFEAAIQLVPSLEMAHYSLGQVYVATKRS